jgi:imidazolonepropionase-like amidohydrolase
MDRDRSRASDSCFGVRAVASWIRAALGASGLALAIAPVRVAAQQTTKSAAGSLVFDGVTVVDVEQGKLLSAQRVVVLGNRIQAVGAANAVQVPAGAQVVDAQGKYLIPGLWDLHTHPRTLAYLFYPLFIANGVTGIRDCWSEIPLDTLTLWRREILDGKRVGPPVQLLSGEALSEEDPAAAQAKVNELKAAGANIIKTYPLNFALAAAARKAGLPFGGHIDGDIPAAEASDSGMTIIDHVNTSGGIDQACWSDAATVEACKPLAERFVKNNTWFVPTLVRMHNHSMVTAPNSQAVFEQFSERVSKFWADTTPKAALNASGAVATKEATSATPRADTLGAMRVMQQVGLPILAGTDAGAPVIMAMPPGFALHAELEMYTAEGLTPLNALQSATLNPAKMFHATDSLGTVAAGKLANLVLLDANPLTDITNTRKIRAVVANGRYFDRAALDSLLAEARTGIKTAEIP